MTPSEITRYCASLEGLGRSGKYVAQVERLLHRFATVPDPQRAVNIYAQRHADASVRQLLTILRTAGRALGLELLRDLKTPARRTGRVAEPGTLTRAEVDQLLAADLSPARRACWLILARTGLRPAELWRVQPGWITTDRNGRASLRLPAGATKARAAAVLPLDPETAEALRSRVYEGLGRRERQRLADTFREDLERAGLELVDEAGRVRTAYSLRGYFGSAVLAAGVPVHVAQRLMRHANPETTLRWYARATEGDLAEALDGVFA